MGFDKRANAKPYALKDGDTLQKIAERETAAGNKLTWQDLAKFNWGTDKPDEVNQFLRDELGCYKRDDANSFVISADAKAKGKLLVPAKFKTSGLVTTKTHTLNVKKQPPPPKQFRGCAMVKGICFEFASSFIRPSVADDLKRLEEELKKHPDGKVMIFGHTDKVGSDEDNKGLSERRALSVYAFITNDADEWEKLYNHPKEKWGLKVVQTILKDLGHDPGPIDGVMGDKTRAAIKSFDPASSDNTPDLRKKLFKAYMTGKHDAKIEADRFMDPKHMGCSEFNPVVATEAQCEANRRVTFYIFHKDRLPKLPCKEADLAPCQQQVSQPLPRHKASFRCSFYDSIAKDCPCEGAVDQQRARLTEVSWAKPEIHPLYYPENADQKIAVVIKTERVSDGTNGSRFEIGLWGYYEEAPAGEDKRAPVELPLSLLGLEKDEDVEVETGQLKSVKSGNRPALELRLPWGEVTAKDGSKVYPVEFATFRVKVKLQDGLPADGLCSDELKRKIPVIVFANPDAVESQKRFWESGETIRDLAKAAGHLALLEAGRTPGKASVFESGVSRGVIPLKMPQTHMRGSSHTFYRGHGYLLTHDGKDPCGCCKFRDHWNTLSDGDRTVYVSNVISPSKWDNTAKRFVAISWADLQKSVKAKDKILVQFEVDESKGDPNFTPATTPGNLPWTAKLTNMFSALVNWDKTQLKEGLQFCMTKPDVARLTQAAALKLGGHNIPVDNTAATGPSFYDADSALKGAPDVVGATGPGAKVPAGTPIYLNTIESKCEQGEDVENKRAGFIFWESPDGETFAAKGGRPAMCFGNAGIAEWLTPDKVDALKGKQPIPTELMYASGCLTAATKELPESFLNKGTKVYIGNRIVAWGTWNRQMADAFAVKVFTDEKSPADAFNELKGEYVGKLRCVMYQKTDKGTEYVDK